MSTRRKTDDQYISVAEAARQLGVSRPTVLIWAGKGELDVDVIAGRPVVTRESVEKHPRAPQTAA
jgi:excisionase family DNA binding protein